MAEHKLLFILLAVGLCLVAGIFVLIDTEDTTTKDTLGATVAVAPPEPSAGSASTNSQPVTGESLPSDSPLAGKVLVSQQAVKVLSAPDPSATELYGFPAGRPFRALARQGGYLRIQDVRSGASGWIEEAALAPAPAQTRAVEATPSEPAPAASAPSSRQRKAAAPKPSRDTSSSSRTAASRPAPEPRRRTNTGGGLFSGNGPLRGLFGR